MGWPAVSMRTRYKSIGDSAVAGTARNSSKHREPITWQLACGKHIKVVQEQSMVKQYSRMQEAGVCYAAANTEVNWMLRLHYADMHT
jgi:hypothetical protein